MLSVQARQSAAAILWKRWVNDERGGELPEDVRPADLAEAWAVQRELDGLAGPRAGWKLAATGAASQEHCGISEPLIGAMYESILVPSGTVFEPTVIQIVEGEFAFSIRGDIERSGASFTRDDVLGHIADVHAGVEVPDSRFTGYPDVSTPQLTADFMMTRHYVLGPPLDVSPDALVDVEMVLRRNGVEEVRKTGRDVLGDPINGLVWLANALAELGESIRDGEIVTTGGCAVGTDIAPGDTVTVLVAGQSELEVSMRGAG